MLIHLLLLFLGGAFFFNAIPHLVSGMMGRKFPTPFATPPGKGESSCLVNVAWGFINLIIAYLLIVYLSLFEIRSPMEAIAVGLGGLLISLHLAKHFGQVYSK